MQYRLILLSAALMLQACSTTKGYEGQNRPAEELAVIYSSEKQSYGVLSSQIVVIEKVNGVEVGDAMRGWPNKVDVIPGEVKLQLKFHTATPGKALLAAPLMLGGAIGGAIAGGIQNAGESDNEFAFQVEKGKAYKLHFSSGAHNASDMKAWLELYVPE